MKRLVAGACAALLLGSTNWAWGQEGLFEKLDANKDGVLTADEIEGEDRKAAFESALRRGDKNEDKKLTKEEFQAGLQRREGDRQPEPGRDSPRARQPEGARPDGPRNDPRIAEEQFNKLDANSDGKLTEDEVPEGQREAFRRMLQTLDSDGDKAIGKDQAPRAIMMLMQRGGPGPDGRPDMRYAEQRFNELDTNKDGKLTEDEIPQQQREAFSQALSRLDDDGDKAITKEQFPRVFMAMMAQRGRPPFGPGVGAMPPMAVLRVLDGNGDGELSKEELENATKSLATLDKNGDGALSREEMFPGGPGGFPGGPGAFPGRPGEGRPDQPRPEGRPGDRPAEGRPAPNAEQLRARLKEMDANGDGKISQEEAQGRIKDGFDRIDANSDGFVDEEELRGLFRRGDGRGPEGRRPEGRPRDGDRPEGRRPAAEGDDKPKEESKTGQSDKPKDKE